MNEKKDHKDILEMKVGLIQPQQEVKVKVCLMMPLKIDEGSYIFKLP
jgi:hypothetical protein